MRIIILFFVVFLSCTSNNNKILSETIEKFYGQEFRIKELVNENSEPVKFQNEFIKIIEFIDSIDCIPCRLENIRIWKKYEKELREHNHELVLITNNSNHEEVGNMLRGLKISYPIYFDDENYIKQNNELIKCKFQIFTLDVNNKIIWIGSPIKSKKSWNIYKKYMENIITN